MDIAVADNQCAYKYPETKERCQEPASRQCRRCNKSYCDLHSERGFPLCDRCRWHYDTAPNQSLPGFERFYSADPRFPIAFSYPKQLKVQFSLQEEEQINVSFEDRSGPCLAVICNDLARLKHGVSLVQGEEDICQYIKQDMEMLKSYTRPVFGGPPPLIEIAATRYKIEWPKCSSFLSRKSFFNDREAEYLHRGGIVGEQEEKVPCAIWQTPQGRYGVRVYIPYISVQRQLIRWTVTRLPQGELKYADFRTVLHSFAWLTDEYFQSLEVS